MNSQQYGCLNKTYTMTTVADRGRNLTRAPNLDEELRQFIELRYGESAFSKDMSLIGYLFQVVNPKHIHTSNTKYKQQVKFICVYAYVYAHKLACV